MYSFPNVGMGPVEVRSKGLWPTCGREWEVVSSVSSVKSQPQQHSGHNECHIVMGSQKKNSMIK